MVDLMDGKGPQAERTPQREATRGHEASGQATSESGVGGGPAGDAALRASQAQTASELSFRYSGGRAGTPPAARLDAQRQAALPGIHRILRKSSEGSTPFPRAEPRRSRRRRSVAEPGSNR
jgi:hypothetical protein